MKLYNISLNNLRRRKSKMLFLVLGLTIAVSTVVTLITVARIMNADIANKLDEFGANILITPKSDDLSLNYGGMAVSGVALDVKQLRTKDAQEILTIENSKNIRIIAPKLLNITEVIDRTVLVVGVEFDQELQLKKWWKLVGRRPATKDQAIIGADAKKSLGLDLNQSFEIQGESFTVTGILQPTGSQDDGVIFIDLAEAQRLFGKPDELSLVEVAALCYDCPIEEIVRQTSEKSPGAKVVAIRQTIESKMEAMHRFEHFSYGISGVVLLVAALIVITNMMASVNERTREIGIFRAIGFRQTHVMKIILTEAFLTSFLSGVSGYFIGAGAAQLVTPLMTVNGTAGWSADYALFAFSIMLAVSVGLVSSIYPAYKASRLDPTVALKAL